MQKIKLGTSKDLAGSKLELPTEVKMELQQVLNVLDEAYGQIRDVDKNLGGRSVYGFLKWQNYMETSSEFERR